MSAFKTLILTLVAITAFSFSNIRRAAKEDLCSSLQKILREADHKFSKIKGDTVSNSEGTVGFVSKMSLPGSIGTTIYVQGDQAYLSSIMYTSNDLEQVKTRYQEIFGLLSKCSFLKEPEKEDIAGLDIDLNAYTYEEKVSKYAHSVELTISPSCSSGYCIMITVWFR